MDGKESFVVGGRIGFSGLALNRFGHWALRGGPSVSGHLQCILMIYLIAIIFSSLFKIHCLFPNSKITTQRDPPWRHSCALATGTGATRATLLVPFFSLLGSAEFLVRCRLCHCRAPRQPVYRHYNGTILTLLLFSYSSVDTF